MIGSPILKCCLYWQARNLVSTSAREKFNAANEYMNKFMHRIHIYPSASQNTIPLASCSISLCFILGQFKVNGKSIDALNYGQIHQFHLCIYSLFINLISIATIFNVTHQTNVIWFSLCTTIYFLLQKTKLTFETETTKVKLKKKK